MPPHAGSKLSGWTKGTKLVKLLQGPMQRAMACHAWQGAAATFVLGQRHLLLVVCKGVAVQEGAPRMLYLAVVPGQPNIPNLRCVS